MKKIIRITIGLVIISMLAACESIYPATTQPTSTAAVIVKVVTNTPETATQALPTVTNAPTDTAVPTATTVPSATTAPTAAPTALGTLPDDSMSNYLDDRSTPAALILSYVNAINRHEYLRAYSYWPNPASYLGTLSNFTNAMSNVSSESISMGQVTSEGAAGSVFYTVPTAVTDTLTPSGTNKYAICFILQFPQPANYGAPPIQPMNFAQYTKTAVSTSTSDASAISSACSGSNTSGLPGTDAVVENLNDLSVNNFIDNRSGAIEVISSLLNAINHKEYVRAYSYWQNPATTVGSYASYAAGYNDTGSVTAIFGTVTSDAGAGQFHYQVPLAMKVITTSNTQQTFVGCYTLHLSNPGFQGTLPFEPLGITAGKFTLVSNSANLAPLIAAACN